MNIKLYKPGTLNESLELISNDSGKIIAGGTDLIIQLRNQHEKPKFLVDISSLPELKEIRIDKDQISIGSAVTFTDIIDNENIKKQLPSLAEMATKIGSVQIQNRATIGGNICNAAPAADSVPLLMSLGAECTVISQGGLRKIPLSSLINNKGRAELSNGEILNSIVFNALKENEGCGFSKLGRRNALAISTISCAVRILLAAGRIENICIYTGSLAIKATKEEKTEEFLKDVICDEKIIEEAAGVLSQDVAERLETRASIPYKRVALKAVFKEACYNAVKELAKDQRYLSGGISL